RSGKQDENSCADSALKQRDTDSSKTSPSNARRTGSPMKALRLALLALFSTAVFAQPAATMRLRGIIEKVDASSVVIKERNGEMMTLALADNLAVNEVLPL